MGRLQLPDNSILEYPDEMDINEVAKHAKKAFPNLFDKPKGRTWGEAALDTGKTLVEGVHSGVGGAVGELIQYAGDKFESPTLQNIGEVTRLANQRVSKEYEDSMTDEGRAMKNQTLFNGLTPVGDGSGHWLGSAALQAVNSLPGMVVTMPIGGVAAKAIAKVGGAVVPGLAGAILKGGAGGDGLIGGASAIEANSLKAAIANRGLGTALTERALALAPTAIGYGGAEGVLAGAQNAAQTRSEIEQKPYEELYKTSPVYRQYVEQLNGDQEGARLKLAKDASEKVLVDTMVSTGGIGALTGGGAMGMIARSSKNALKQGLTKAVLKEAGKGAAEEAGQEFLQSGSEAYIQNKANQQYVDPSIDPLKGALTQAMQGAAVGGLTGAAFGGSGELNNHGASAPKAIIPLTQPQAELSAKQKTESTGIPHEVVAHPTAQGKFTAVPVQQSNPDTETPPINNEEGNLSTDEEMLKAVQEQGIANASQQSSEDQSNIQPSVLNPVAGASQAQVNQDQSIGDAYGGHSQDQVIDQQGAEFSAEVNAPVANSAPVEPISAPYVPQILHDNPRTNEALNELEKTIHESKQKAEEAVALSNVGTNPDEGWGNSTTGGDANNFLQPSGEELQAVPENTATPLSDIGQNSDGYSSADGESALIQKDATGEQVADSRINIGRDEQVLQNRDRTTPESIEQMKGIARKPDPSRLSFSRDATNGAPIVYGDIPASSTLGKFDIANTADGRKLEIQYAAIEADDLIASHTVDGLAVPEYDAGIPGKLRAIGGNARVAGLKAAHSAGNAGGYIDGIAEDASLHGVSPEDIKGMTNPVLVRIMRAEDVTANIGDELNGRANMEQPVLEQAKNDVRRVKLENLSFTEDGRIDDRSVRGFVQSMPENERAGMMDGSQPGKRAVDRLNAAMFYQAYGDDELVRLYAQSTDAEAETVIRSLAIAAPAMAQLEGLDIDVRAIVADAAKVAINAKRMGKSLLTASQQQDIEYGDTTMWLVKYFSDNIRSPKRISEMLTALAIRAHDESVKSDFDMFGKVEKKNVEQLLQEQGYEPRTKKTDGIPARIEPVPITGRGKADEPKGQADGAPVKAVAFSLEGETNEQIAQAERNRAAQNRAQQADEAKTKAEQAKKERDAASTRAKVHAANPDNFVMGESSNDAVKPMGSLFDQQPAAKSKPSDPNQAALAAIKASDIPQAEQIRLAADLRKGNIDAEDVHGMVGEVPVNDGKTPANAENQQKTVDNLDKNGNEKQLGKKSKVEQSKRTPLNPDQAAIDQADADFDNAMSDLGDIFGKNFRATLTPEQDQKLLPVLTKLFDAAFRKGYYKFKESARFVLDSIKAKFGAEISDQISIDSLQGAYIGMAGRYKDQGADKPLDVASVESKDELGESNVTDKRSSTNLERNSQDAESQDGVGAQGVSDEQSGNGGTGGRRIPATKSESGAGGSVGVREDEASTIGEPSHNEVHFERPSGVKVGTTGDMLGERGDSSGLDGLPVESDAANVTKALAKSGTQQAALKEAQYKADTEYHHGKSLAEIRAALPTLLEGQQEDVHKTEQQFSKPDGYGMLFTNGTGTGKTFTGLGVIKRFVNAGKKNILIVAPNKEIAAAWVNSAPLVGLKINLLESTRSAGQGIVITTYANMGANDSLAKRDWDLIVQDEAHSLMSNEAGESTLALDALRAISLHPNGAHNRAMMLHGKLYREASILAKEASGMRTSDDQNQRYAAEGVQKKSDALFAQFRELADAIKEEVKSRQGEARPRVLFLSATPFSHEKTVMWADGYLFDTDAGRGSQNESRGYNSGSNSDQFMMQHFGYRMRNGKLTEPDAKVDRGLMQRQFNAMLKKSGAISGRMLDVPYDYDRRFVLVDSAIGQRIDAALQWFDDQRELIRESNKATGTVAKIGEKNPRSDALYAVQEIIHDKFDYLSRRFILESIKARESIPIVKAHLALGRKVLVFHDYNKGGAFNPFNIEKKAVGQDSSTSGDASTINGVIAEFMEEFSDLINSDLFNGASAIEEYRKAFPNIMLYNGQTESNSSLKANLTKFQDDASGSQVMLVQSDKGQAGISAHDTTGMHQRVMLHLGQPTKPVASIQQEGRIYRTGQKSDAIFRYLTTGTNWEKWTFATTIAHRASTAENLGMGEQARALKDAFMTAYDEADNYPAGHENEGMGGKERDKAANNALTEYDRARSLYFGTQKKNSRTKAQEGSDYFATPEPVGLKMVELADIRPGESVLEPSAGHGAIARWITETAERSAIEPSAVLRPRLAMVFDGKIIGSDFENMHVSNKFDAIVMNPPFGVGGKTAIEHLAKAATHLRDGGRIVALIPQGSMADKLFDKWMYSNEEQRPVKPIHTDTTHGTIYEGDTLTMNAFGSDLVITDVVIDGSGRGPFFARPKGALKSTGVNLTALKSIKPTGARTESYSRSKGFSLVAEIKLPSVTFERAGTAVNTRIVVIEKSDSAPQLTQRDYSGETDINELFNRMESLSISPRAKAEEDAQPAKEEAQQKPEKSDKTKAGDVVTIENSEYPIEIYTTNDGKDKRGVWMNEAQARKLNPRAFKTAKNNGTPNQGKFFVDEYWLAKAGIKAAAQNVTEFSRKETDKGVALFSKRAEHSSLPPVSESLVNSVISRLDGVRQAAGDARVTVVFAVDELPEAILAQANLEKIPHNEILGVLHNGQAYIVRHNIKSEQEIEETLIHEVMGHGGVHALLGDSREGVLLEAFNRAGGIVGIRRIAYLHGVLDELNKRIPQGKLNENQKIALIDEMLALAQGKNNGLRQTALEWWNKVRNHIIGALNKLGFTGIASKLDKFDAGEAAVMLRQMREAVIDGGDIGGRGVSFMVAWHGSPHDHDKFDSSRIGTDTTARNPHTLSTLATAIDQAMGGGFTKLLEATGKFKLITSDEIGEYLSDGVRFSKSEISNSSQTDTPDIRYSKDGRILAFVKNGETFLVADNISSTDDNVKGLLTHEVALHALALGRSTPEFQAILKAFSIMGKVGNQQVRDAQARVPEDTPANLVDEESLGYYLEANPDLTLSKRIVSWFKEQIRKIGNTLPALQRLEWFRAITKLTLEDIVYMAQNELKSAPNALRETTMESAPKFSMSQQQPIDLNTPVQPESHIPEEIELQKRQRQVQDKMNRFSVLQEWLKEKGVSLSEKADVHAIENLMHAKIANQTQDFRDHVVAQLIERTSKLGFTLSQVADYLEAQHIPEANARMRKIHHDLSKTANGVTDSEARKALAYFQAMPNFAEFKKVADEFRAIGDETLDMRLREGLISQDQYDAYKGTYQHWVPLRGDGKKPGVGKGLSVNAKEKRRLGHGQREDGEMVIENLLMDRERAIYQVEHNRVGKSIIQFALEAKEPDMITVGKPEKRQVYKDQQVFEVQYKGNMMRAFSSESDAKAFINQAIALSTSRSVGAMARSNFAIAKSSDPRVIMQASPMLAENEIQVYVAGHTIRVQLNDELLARAATNMGVDQVNSLLAAGRAINNGLSKMYTAYSPDFIFRNLIRDFIAGTVNLTGDLGAKMALKIYGNYGKAAKELFIARNDPRKSAWVQRYRQAGGNTGAAYLSDIERIGSDVRAAMYEYMKFMEVYHTEHDRLISEGKNEAYSHIAASMKSGAAKFKSVPVIGHFLTLIEHLNAVTENALRLATYMTLVESGYSEQKSAAAAKNSTVNFNRKGEISNVMGAAYLFFNPTVQGSARMFSTLLKSEHKGQALAMAGMLAFAAFALAEQGRGGDDDDEREWKNIPDHVKDHNLIFKFGDLQYTMPVPYEFAVFHALGNSISDAAHGESAWKSSMKVLKALVDNLSPLGDPFAGESKDGVNFFQMTPTVVKMALAPHENQNSFGSPIQPEKSSFSKNKPDSQNMFRNTEGSIYAGAAEWVNEMTSGSAYKSGGVDVSPEVLKFWVSSLTGGTGRFVADSIDAAYGAANGVAPELRSTPIARVFARESSVADARSRFWEAANEARIAADELALARKDRNGSAVKEIREADGDMIRLSKMADRMGKAASKKRDAIDAIRLDDQMPMEQKREQMKAIEKKEGEYYDKFLKAFDTAEKVRRDKAA